MGSVVLMGQFGQDRGECRNQKIAHNDERQKRKVADQKMGDIHFGRVRFRELAGLKTTYQTNIEQEEVKSI